MKFIELDRKSQEFLIGQLDLWIDHKAEENNINDYISPTREEYEDFFNAFDKDYKMVEGFPESIIDIKEHPGQSIQFEDIKIKNKMNKKAVLRVED